MNISKIGIVALDEMFKGVKSKHVWFFSGTLAFICFLAMRYSPSLPFLFSDPARIPFTYVSYMIILLLGPFFILITAFDSISGEVEKGTVRYIISKIDRESFVLAKFLFSFLIFSFFALIVAIIGQMYNYQSVGTFDLERMLLFWIFSSLYIACFTSIFIFVSALSKSSKMAFTMSALLLGIIIYFSVQGRTEYLRYITPYHYGFAVSEIMKNTYEIVEYSNIVQNLLAMLVFIVATLSIDVFTFKRREL